MWADVARVCTMWEAALLHYKFLCRYHFLLTDFMTPEGIRLNRLAVPLGLDSASHSILPSSDCKTCLTSPVMMSTNAFIYFKEYRDDKLSLTYPSERLVETVSASVTVLDGMMAEVAHTYSVEEKITAAIKNTVDFGWIQSSGCSRHHQEIVMMLHGALLEYLFLGGGSEETGY